MKHLVFVVNPHSGVNRKKQIQSLIEQTLNHQVFSYEIAYTAYPKHGTAIAQEAAAKGYFAVIAVGGDGSVNDVAHGLINTTTRLGIIPMGSGNGLARSLNIPLNIKKAIEILNHQNCIQMDVGWANQQPFVSNVGVGFDALVAEQFSHSTSRGFFTYAWLILKNLITFQPKTYQFLIDEQPFQRTCFLLNIANGKQFGYNFQIAPDASWTDGVLDVVVIKPFPFYYAPIILHHAMNGTLRLCSYVECFRGQEITINLPLEAPFQIDGDTRPTTSILDIHVQTQAIHLLVP